MFSFFLKNATWCSLTHSLLVTFHGAMLLYVAYEARINFTYWWLVSQKKNGELAQYLLKFMRWDHHATSCTVAGVGCAVKFDVLQHGVRHTPLDSFTLDTQPYFSGHGGESKGTIVFPFLGGDFALCSWWPFFAEWTNPTCGKCWKLSI